MPLPPKQEPPAYYRPLVPNGCRRAPWHDYRSRCIYMITINRAPGILPFSSLAGIPGSHDWKPRTILTPTGEIIASCISELKAAFPFIRILRRVIMPEHVHFVLFVTEATDTHLGDIILELKGECTRRYHGTTKQAGRNAALQSVFEEGYHDRILLKEGQLQRMLAYVSDNPRRRLERISHPDFFHRTLLAGPDGTRYEAYGNIHLLEDPDIEAVKVSRKYSPDELIRRKRIWMRTVQNGGVLVSPFISPAEKKVENWACQEGGRIILITDNGFGTNYTPKGMLHTLCSEGRLLIIAPTVHRTTSIALDRATCLQMNALAETVAAYSLRRL